MNPLKHILIGVETGPDGRIPPGCVAALQQGASLAASACARLSLAYVLPDGEEGAGASGLLQPEDSLRRLAGALPVRADCRVLSGPAWSALIDCVRRERVDLLIVGAGVRGMSGRVVFGGTARKLLRYCPCPVWTVRAGGVGQMSTVLVAHDLRSAGSRALRLGLEMAQLHQARLRILHVLEPEGWKPWTDSRSARLEQDSAEARRWLEMESRGMGWSADEAPDISIRQGNPCTALLEYLNTHHVDIVCMGTVARRGSSAFVTGDTAGKMLSWISCSLLSVKPEGFEPATAEVPVESLTGG